MPEESPSSAATCAESALELFERFSDEIVDVCAEAAMKKPSASLIVIDEGDLE